MVNHTSINGIVIILLGSRGAVAKSVDQICKSTSEWRGFELYQSGFE